MDKIIIDNAFKLSSELLDAICLHDFKTLHEKFNMPQVVWDEIKTEVLDYYFENINPVPRLYPSEQRFDVFKYSDDDGWGIEADLFDESGKWTELTLHAEMILADDGQYKMQYRLIEVM